VTATNSTAEVQTTIVDRIPTWATSVQLEPDGYVLFSRVVRDAVEIQQSSHLAVDEEAGTVSYQPVGGLQLWIPDIEASIGPERARALLVDLQELLVVVDEIQAAEALDRTADLLEMSV